MSEGRIVKLASPSTLSITASNHPHPARSPANGHQTVISNGTNNLNHQHHQNPHSTSSPSANSNSILNHDNLTSPPVSLKLERPTPTATPTSTLSMTPTPISPILHHPNYTAIMEPVQNMPLDLVSFTETTNNFQRADFSLLPFRDQVLSNQKRKKGSFINRNVREIIVWTLIYYSYIKCNQRVRSLELFGKPSSPLSSIQT